MYILVLSVKVVGNSCLQSGQKTKIKCKMTLSEANIWSITLSPNIREWFGSGKTPVNQLGIVIRSADGSKKGIDTDSFIAVTDTKYEGFAPGEIKTAAVPADMVEGINIMDNSTVTLVLYDKDVNGNHKDFAHVVGDFNNWTLSNDEKSQMYRDDASGCWWITLAGLDAGKEYAFQYYVGTKEGEVIHLADAYTEKILDPDNDKDISASTYNENLVYPKGGVGIVSTFKIQKDSYNWKYNDFKIANPEQLVIYELHLRDFTATSDINGAMGKLSYLKEMGVNAIELMPVQEFDGNDSWGYNPCFFFAMDKAYGTKQCISSSLMLVMRLVWQLFWMWFIIMLQEIIRWLNSIGMVIRLQRIIHTSMWKHLILIACSMISIMKAHWCVSL